MARVRSVFFGTLVAINSPSCTAPFVGAESSIVQEPLTDRPARISTPIPAAGVKKSARTGLGPGLLLESRANRSILGDHEDIAIYRAELWTTR